MDRARKALCVLLGMLLLGQDSAVFATPFVALPDAAMREGIENGRPCHPPDPGVADGERDACCDAGCPSMAACALGHLAVVPAGVAIASIDLARSVPARDPAAAREQPPGSLLRPPIALHD